MWLVLYKYVWALSIATILKSEALKQWQGYFSPEMPAGSPEDGGEALALPVVVDDVGKRVVVASVSDGVEAEKLVVEEPKVVV